MSHNDLTVTYDNLEQIRMKFLDLSNQVADIQKPIQLTFQQLQSGGWSGKGAAAFFDQLDDDVLPTLRRMGNQFDGSANITKQLAQTFSNAENEASQLFKMGDSVEFSTKRLGGWFGGENAFSDKLSAIFGADQLSTHALGANAVFKKDYMRGMIKKHFSGEDDPKLNHAMESLLTGKNIEASLY